MIYPGQFIKLVENDNNNIVFNDNLGNQIVSPVQNNVILADITNVSDNDLPGGNLPTSGTYKWFRSTTNTPGVFDGILFRTITGSSGSTYTVEQTDVNSSIYVQYEYIGFGTDKLNTAISGKTNFIQKFS